MNCASVSLLVLLLGVVSTTPLGGVTVTALILLPVAVEAKTTVSVKVRLEPTGKFAVVLRAPLPLVAPETVAPAVAETNVQVAPLVCAGKVSTMEAPRAPVV